MPVPVVAALWAGLAATIVPMAVRLLLGIGFAVAVYQGVDAVFDAAKAQIWSNLGGVAANIMTLIVMAKVDEAVAVVLSAAGSLMLLKGVSAATGALAKGRWNAPAP